jgi:hypothetical protein
LEMQAIPLFWWRCYIVIPTDFMIYITVDILLSLFNIAI